MGYDDWLAPPAYDAVGPRAPRPELGTVAAGLVAAGPVLMALGFAWTIALGQLFPLPLYVAAFLTVALAPAGLVVAAVAVCRDSGRWRAVVAAVAAVPVSALAFSFVLPVMELLRNP